MDDLKKMMLDLIEEEFSPKPIPLASKWEQGMMILKPAGDQQAKEVPLEIFFKKIISIRENLRVLEQKINSAEYIPTSERISLQAYITKCYGSLTTFNVLFKEDRHRFVGAGQGQGEKSSGTEKMTLGQARKKLGLAEHGDT